MWIEETKNGKYKFVEQYTDYMTGKRKRVSVTLDKKTAAAKRTAMEALTRMIEQRQSVVLEEKELTFSELVDKYREYQKLSVKAATYTRNYYACETLKKMLNPDILVNRLTANYIKECFLHSGKANSTLNEHRVRLFALLNWAYENDYIQDVSFLKKIKPFKAQTKKEKVQDKYLEASEVQKLLSAMDSEKWKLLTKFLLLSGLRIGEAVALNAADIDFQNHVIHITKNYDSVNKVITTPKTLCSIRDVFMQQELEKLCKNIILYTKAEGLALGYRTKLFMCSSKGNYLNYYSFNKYLRENAAKAIGRQITAHTLRHTHASLLLAQGVPIDTISRRLGHENSIVTREIYLHVTEKLTELDNEKLKTTHII